MFFQIIEGFYYPYNTKSKVFLTWDNWNDYAFYTLFGIFYVDNNSQRHELGNIKIGHYGQEQNERQLKKNDSFDFLNESFFSVGLDENYYQALNDLGEEIRDKILNGLNDIARNSDIYLKSAEEEVFKVSFLRAVSPTTIQGQFRRLAFGGVRLTNYNFNFITPSISDVSSMNLSFNVEPDSNPPTNIHILIGRNGVGKTNLIHNMIDSLTENNIAVNKGHFISNQVDEIKTPLFANLICITFSAFDEFDHPPEKKDKSIGIQYSYIGLKDIQEVGQLTNPKNPALLKDEFIKSIIACKNNSKIEKWKKTINTLESDPIFKDENITSLIDTISGTEFKERCSILFDKLSSGHKIVLLTITRLVETLQERSLVLIDEPEAHLHPPLLSSFIRTISELMIDKNAVSIIATHSPVILQEIPRKCVWNLRRSGTVATAERLGIESFGENVGILTQEVFNLEVTTSGFHTILKSIVNNTDTFEEALNLLNNNIGLEAMAILRNLFYQKDKLNENNF
jgi:predicted ATPase